MQVAQLGLNQLSAALLGSKQNPSGAPATNAASANTGGGNDAADTTSVTYRQILANYDVTDITPRQFSQLLYDLHSAGAINDADLQELSSIRFELDRAGYDPDEPVNLVEMFKNRLDSLQASAASAATGLEESDQSPEARQQTIAQTKRQIDWLQKFATVHADSSTEAVNTLV